MADIELVIKIPERIHYGIEKGITVNGSKASQILIDAVKNATPLPKGHGRLIDADRLVPDCQEDFVYYDDDEHNVFTAVGIAQIECADTIIEADEAESEEI